MTVTFFGHRNTPSHTYTRLENTVRGLIEHEGADTFYVGNQGSFDAMAASVLSKLQKEYPCISCTVVLAYMPREKKNTEDSLLPSVLPEEVAVAIPKFAISKRNIWMLSHSDTVVAYVTHDYGGAAGFVKAARRKGKRIISLAEEKD